MRYCLLFSCFFLLNIYAVNADSDKKKIPMDHSMEHPDHVPHHGGKDPIKKVTQDELIFPRKKRKIHRIVVV